MEFHKPPESESAGEQHERTDEQKPFSNQYDGTVLGVPQIVRELASLSGAEQRVEKRETVKERRAVEGFEHTSSVQPLLRPPKCEHFSTRETVPTAPEWVSIAEHTTAAATAEEARRAHFVLTSALESFWLSAPHLRTYAQEHDGQGVLGDEAVFLEVPTQQGQTAVLSLYADGQTELRVSGKMPEMPNMDLQLPDSFMGVGGADFSNQFTSSIAMRTYSPRTLEGVPSVLRYDHSPDANIYAPSEVISASEAEAAYVAQLLQRAEPAKITCSGLYQFHAANKDISGELSIAQAREQSQHLIKPFYELIERYTDRCRQQEAARSNESVANDRYATHRQLFQRSPDGAMSAQLSVKTTMSPSHDYADILNRLTVIDHPSEDAPRSMRRIFTHRVSAASDPTGPQYLSSSLHKWTSVIDEHNRIQHISTPVDSKPVPIWIFSMLKRYLDDPQMPRMQR
jgi:hypothetical protein